MQALASRPPDGTNHVHQSFRSGPAVATADPPAFAFTQTAGAYYSLLDLLESVQFDYTRDNLLCLGGVVGPCRCDSRYTYELRRSQLIIALPAFPPFRPPQPLMPPPSLGPPVRRYNDEVIQFLARRRALGPLGELEAQLLSLTREPAASPTPASPVSAGQCAAQQARAASALTAALRGKDAKGACDDQHTKRGDLAAAELLPAAPAVVGPPAVAAAAAAAAAVLGVPAAKPLKADNMKRLAAAPLILGLPEYLSLIHI